jgi:methylated-DNA-[protein]-cysteine S-methyltransferase
MTYYTHVESPLGKLLMISDGENLTGVSMPGQKHAPEINPAWTKDAAVPILSRAAAQLGEYFSGQRTNFDLPLALHGTDFQRSVWAALRTIPFGSTLSYSDLALRVGNARAVRAVGLANGRNPIAVIVPCHRVIGVDGSLTGYAGGLDRKQRLLSLEAIFSKF